VEVRFHPFQYQPVFADTDLYLQSLGFSIYHLRQARHARTAFSPAKESATPGATEEGQVLWGQAIYLRDAIAEMRMPDERSTEWTQTRLLKLVSFMDLFSLRDCAAEIVQSGLVERSDTPYMLSLLQPERVSLVKRLWRLLPPTVRVKIRPERVT